MEVGIGRTPPPPCKTEGTPPPLSGKLRGRPPLEILGEVHPMEILSNLQIIRRQYEMG